MTTAIEQTVLHLPMKERAHLALLLLQSLEPLDETEFDRAWGDESARRVAAASGNAVSGDEVARKARALLR